MFLYCDSLTRVRIPGVRRFGRQVFVNDVLLKEVEISRELDEESICDVFTGCGNIRLNRILPPEINLSSGNEIRKFSPAFPADHSHPEFLHHPCCYINVSHPVAPLYMDGKIFSDKAAGNQKGT